MSTYCKHCGAKLDPNQKHDCPKLQMWIKIKNFWLRLVDYFKNDTSVENEDDRYERGKSIVPDSIEADDGEVVIKQYDLAILRTRHKLTRAEGRMQITNKRLLFRATGRSPVGKTIYQSEFAMDKIDGVEIRRDYRFLLWDFFINSWISGWFGLIGALFGLGLVKGGNTFPAIIVMLLSLATAAPFFMLRKRYLLKLLVLSIGYGLSTSVIYGAAESGKTALVVLTVIIILFLIVLYIISMFLSLFQPNLVIEIKTSSGSPGVQIKHRFASFFIWKKMEENSGFAEILPGKDADLAIKEIGAIINDIKTLGDIGIEKWQAK